MITGPILEIGKGAFSSKKGGNNSISRVFQGSTPLLWGHIFTQKFWKFARGERHPNVSRIGPASRINGLHWQGHILLKIIYDKGVGKYKILRD